MKELSLHILDITKNSVSAGAKNISLSLTETQEHALTIVIADDGRGMTPEFLARVTDPFTTTRTTRKVGLGLPLLKMAAEGTGGTLFITSIHKEEDEKNCGTTVKATFYTNHIDCPPLGDVVSTVVLLVQSAPFLPRYIYRHVKDGKESHLDTRELHEQLGGDIPLNEPEILSFIGEYLKEQEDAL